MSVSSSLSPTLLEILHRVASGSVAPKDALKDALEQCRPSQIEDVLHGLTLDTQREWRTGLGEVVFAQNKSDAQLREALRALGEHGSVLATRVNAAQGAMLQNYLPEGHYYADARLFSLGKNLPIEPPLPANGRVLVLSAGAADRSVALECFGALVFWNIEAGFIADVGVAGLHRLAPHIPALTAAHCIVAVAGMEGALPGVVAGLVRCPVLAVPTSVGYGVGAGGLAALSTMLCTCVPGVAVCNIDNGFGAAAFAAKLLHTHP